MGTSYGLIEIPSTTAAIDVLDIMCKTADVEFVTWEKKLGGRLVTIIVRGTISAVTEAVEAACAHAIKKPVAKAVIANTHAKSDIIARTNKIFLFITFSLMELCKISQLILSEQATEAN